MAMIKCSECGQMVSDQARICGNCGAPVVVQRDADQTIMEAIPVQEPQPRPQPQAAPQQPQYRPQPQYQTQVNQGFQTTDTGYSHERAIKIYANICFWIYTVFVVLAAIGGVVVTAKQDNIVIGIAGALILAPILIMLAYVFKAMLVVYSNISINLHELNMKKT